MPYKSSKQRAYMHIHNPEIAKRWDKKYGGKVDSDFYTHNTHSSLQEQEESVKTSGDGFTDSSVPKVPKTDCFYDNVSNWAR